MANYFEPEKEQVDGWNRWVETLPKNVKLIASKFNPWTLYRLKTTNRNVIIYSFSDDGTITVIISSDFNENLLFDRRVFGIDPNDLEECDLPDITSGNVPVLNDHEVEENIDILRCIVRPDLFIMNSEGKAVKKAGKL